MGTFFDGYSLSLVWASVMVGALLASRTRIIDQFSVMLTFTPFQHSFALPCTSQTSTKIGSTVNEFCKLAAFMQASWSLDLMPHKCHTSFQVLG